MATVRGLTAERMLEIEGNSIVGGQVDANKHLILTTQDGATFDAGSVEGPQGVPGMPAGSIAMWTSASIPGGWIEADGRAVSRVTYSDLFSIIGSQYGNGDGANTFNVPDLRGRIVVGHNPGDVTFDTLNKIGGEKEHLLTVNELPAHTHRFTYQGSSYSDWPLLGNTTSLQNVGFGAGDKFTGAERPIGLTSVGGNLPHNVLQPYRVLKYIIKGIGGVGELTSTVESVLLDRTASVELEVDALQVDMPLVKQDIAKLKAGPPVFQARMAVNHSLSGAATWQKIIFGEETVDRANNYDPTLSRFTAPEAGVYEFSFSVTNSTNSAGPGFSFFINGVRIHPTRFDVMGYYEAYKTVGATRMFNLNSGDYVEVWWSNNNGVSTTLAASYGGLFSGKKV